MTRLTRPHCGPRLSCPREKLLFAIRKTYWPKLMTFERMLPARVSAWPMRSPRSALPTPSVQTTLQWAKTRLPMLAAFQGRLNPSKLSSALSMIDEIDKYAVAAGKDDQYREKLRKLVDKDLAEKIEHTTSEEFSRYVGQRKNDLLASVDPDDQNFRQQHTEAMHDVRRVGPVRGNKNAIEYRLTLDAEGDEATQTLLTTLTTPRGKGDDEEFERRSAGQRRMHALRDVIKFSLANLDKAG